MTETSEDRPGPDPQGPSPAGDPPLRGPSLPEPPPAAHPDEPLPVEAERERDEYLDALRRLQADFENYKKRMLRQQTEILGRAGEDLVTKLLPVLDTIDLARQHGEGEAIAPVASSLVDALVKEGLERIDPVGDAFDPNEHEAVAHEPVGDDDEAAAGPVVSGLMRAGYRWKGRLLRAAMVTVKG